MGAAGRELRALAAAVALLTRVPIGARVAVDESDLSRALAWMPLVGAGLGAALALAAHLLDGRLDTVPAAVVIVIAWTLASGAIHLDGVADSADALGGGDAERRLEIMRDPRLGTFGALALIFVVTLKVALVASVLTRDHALWLLAAPAVGRASAAALASAVPYARAAGTGAGVAHGGARPVRAGIAVATAAVAALACAQGRGFVALGAAALVTLSVGRLAHRRLGGVTGDVFGAAIELSECAVLLALVAGS